MMSSRIYEQAERKWLGQSLVCQELSKGNLTWTTHQLTPYRSIIARLWQFHCLIALLHAICSKVSKLLQSIVVQDDFERHVCIYTQLLLHFMHDLDIACKNVLISHNFMMHANACCTCNLISTCTK